MSLDYLLKKNIIYKYILNHTQELTALQQEFFNQAIKDKKSNMMTPPEQIKLIELLIKLINAKNAIEIGVFRGFSTLAIASVLPVNGCLYACDITDQYLNKYKKYLKHYLHKINFFIGPAKDSLQQIMEEKKNYFDFIYIDADKNNYLYYYKYSYQLLRKNGIIVLDNMLRKGLVTDINITNKSIQLTNNLNKIIRDDPLVDASLLPIGDGMTIIRKK